MSARRRRHLEGATFVVLVAGGLTTVTAAPLFAGADPAPLVIVHVIAASAFFVGLAVKLALLGARARPARARRLWRLLVAQLGGGLAAYTLTTGVLVVLDPAWSDQHLAASFWLNVVVFAHARQYVGRHRRPSAASRAHLDAAPPLRRLDPSDVALLDLSLRKGLSDARLAAVLRLEAGDVRQRRRRALERLGGAADLEQRLRRLPPEAWHLCARSGRLRRLVVVGGGMAGQALVEHMATRAGWQTTLLAEEDVEPYNRISLSEVLRHGGQGERLALRPPGWYAAAGVDLRLGSPAVAIDVERRRVTERSGMEHRYDALVLATGSRAFMPPIPGAQLGHVIGYRTLRDAETISRRSARARTAVVVGGGVLGLEAAAAVAARGLAVTVVEAGPRLLAQQLDDGAAALLRRSLSRMGIETLVEATVTEITASEVRLADDHAISAELVIVAAGIRAETALARAASLAVERGIVVDDHMRTSAPSVWAVGECAQHRGVVHGLWAPVAEQVRAVVGSLEGEPLAFAPAAPKTTLKAAGLEVFATGRTSARAGDDEILRSDGRRGTYAKLVVAGDRLVGAILVGDASDAGRLGQLVASGGPVPADVFDPRHSERRFERPPREAGRHDELVCRCLAVSRGRLERAIDEAAGEGVEGVVAATGATTGCGSCALTVKRMVDDRQRVDRPRTHPSAVDDSPNRSECASA